MRLLGYLITIAVVVQLLVMATRTFFGETAGAVMGLLAVYALTVFDVRMASPAWSMFRRILPNVSLLDCLIYAAPFGVMIAIVAYEDLRAWWISVPIIFLAVGVYFLLRLPEMRRGSRDDLSWLFSTTMSVRERLQRYLGQFPGVAPSNKVGE